MIKPLTSLRFIFAFMIFLFHLFFWRDSEVKMLNWIYNNILSVGYIGVSFFFILSGFILAYNYQEKILTNKISKKDFYIARFARIYPLHLLTFIIAIPLTFHVFTNNLKLWVIQAVTNLSLTQSLIPVQNINFSFNEPSWSISAESFFYFIFPFLILLTPKLTKKRLFIPFLIFVIAAIPLLVKLVPDRFCPPSLLNINPIVRCLDFIIGIMLYNFYNFIKKKEIKVNYNLLELFALVLFIFFFLFRHHIPNVYRYSFYYWIPMCYLILVISFQRGFISKILSNNILILLGEISFGFYLFHQLVLRYLQEFSSIKDDITLTVLAFLLSLLISYLSYRWFETPMNKFIKKRSKKKKHILINE